MYASFSLPNYFTIWYLVVHIATMGTAELHTRSRSSRTCTGYLRVETLFLQQQQEVIVVVLCVLLFYGYKDDELKKANKLKSTTSETRLAVVSTSKDILYQVSCCTVGCGLLGCGNTI